ncbi:C166A protein, partial [Atractosteus spatula]|nr:C166A protein [Atractosteus spatula]
MRSPVCSSYAVIAIGAIIAAVLQLGCSSEKVTALYGETIEVPCSLASPKPKDLMFVKWKFETQEAGEGDLLTKQEQKDGVKILAKDEYKDRVNVTENFSLRITKATLQDEKTFTCLVVTMNDAEEHSTSVRVYKLPSKPQIKEKAKQLENGKLTLVGDCVTEAGNPAGNITWSKNGSPLVSDGKLIVITNDVTVDPTTGLSSTSSKLKYTASKSDVGAQFTCSVQHSVGPDQVSSAETFVIHYPSEKVNIEVLSKGPFKEGDNVTLKCSADGNPPPSSYSFYVKGKKETVQNSNTYTVTSVRRDDSGEYKCSLVDDDKLLDSANITVHYMDASLSPTGKITRMLGESVNVTLVKQSSTEVKVSWMKDSIKIAEPKLNSLKIQDAGSYVCEVSAPSLQGVKKTFTFDLTVEAKPYIYKLNKLVAKDGQQKVLTCEAEGSPKPTVRWNVNATSENERYVNGRIVHTITMFPLGNVTVTCTVSNKLGKDERSINVSSLINDDEEEKSDMSEDTNDQAKLIVGIVVGLILAALVVGLVYWLYMKKSKQGSWKTGEKEAGTSEESKKLEENNHKVEV